jgi:preprotein translocase subunit SecG
MDILLGFLNVVIVILTLFLIVLILIQRGKGGGLAGAFGGMGGSSAFGARTGDVFTKVTVWVAFAWIGLSMFMVVLTNRKPPSDWQDNPAATTTDSGRDSKSKSKDSSGTGSTSRSDVPEPLGTTLPADVKALNELPDPLETMPIPSKKQ